MLLNKKWKISLGILTATLPLITVVSCTGVLKSQNEKTTDLFNKIVSKHVGIFWEKEWIIKVLDEAQKDSDEKIDFRNIPELLKNQKFKELIKHFISHELHKNVDFLKDLGLKLSDISDNNFQKKYSEAFLKSIGLKHQYFDGFENSFITEIIEQNHPVTGIKETKSKIEWIADILMNEKKLDFSNSILKYFVVEEYLKTNKKDYQEFKSKLNERNYIFNQIENSIDEKNFLLIKYLLKERLFFKWEIEENSNSKPNNNFLQEKAAELIKSIKQFLLKGDKTTIADFSKYSDQFKKLIKEIWDLKELNDVFKEHGIDFHSLIGYLGISSQELGSGKLDFDSLEELKKITKSDDWFGFLQGGKDAKDKELIKEKINFVLKGKNGHLKMIFGIMPIFKDNKLTLDGTFFAKDIHKLAWLLYSNSKNNSENIFNEAIDYFAGDKDKGGKDIKIEIKNEAITKELKEKMKLKFIK